MRSADVQPAARATMSGHALDALAVVDLSWLPRCGIKGPHADGYLRALGVIPPSAANTWTSLDGGGVVARLGRNEFLLEDGPAGSVAARVRDALEEGATAGIYPVPRHDFAVALAGPRVHELFAQTCSFDLRELERKPDLTLMTMMMEVSVIIAACPFETCAGFRVWCDGSYGTYLHNQLIGIASELCGGAASISALDPDARAPAAAQSPCTGKNDDAG